MKYSLYSLSLILLVAPACDTPKSSPSELEPASTTHLTAARPSAPASAATIEAIADARCLREDRCGNVGEGRKYSNREACVNEVRAKGDNELTSSSCPAGVDSARLSGCMSAIGNERCENPLDLVGRLAACRLDSLCPPAAAK